MSEKINSYKPRINHDEIQKKLESYLKKRNFATDNINLKMNEKSIDLNTMTFNDLASIESTIHDYYLYSKIYSTSENEYFKQYCT